MNSISAKGNTVWVVASVFSLLYSSNAGIADDATPATSTIMLQYYGRERGAQLVIRQPGIAEFRKGKPGRWDRPVVTRNVDPEKFRKLLAAMELFIASFPCGGYAPLKVSDPAYYTVSYTRNHLTEELTFEGIDRTDAALVRKANDMLESLHGCAMESPHLPAFSLHALMNPFGDEKINLSRINIKDIECNAVDFVSLVPDERIDLWTSVVRISNGKGVAALENDLSEFITPEEQVASIRKLQNLYKKDRTEGTSHLRKVVTLMLKRNSEATIDKADRFAIRFRTRHRSVQIGFPGVERSEHELVVEMGALLKFLNQHLSVDFGWSMEIDEMLLGR